MTVRWNIPGLNELYRSSKIATIRDITISTCPPDDIYLWMTKKPGYDTIRQDLNVFPKSSQRQFSNNWQEILYSTIYD